MLSICIPIYNRDLRDTVCRLNTQASMQTIPVEIICIDDHSEESYHQLNLQIADKANYIRLPENVGRARIRNLFLQYAQYEYLLFLDCDSIIPDNFLHNYLALLQQNPSVICGGRVYDKQDDDREHHLRYLYGMKCECKNADERTYQPYKSFMTNNFVVHRKVLQQVPFDERISRYGHEDTLFGYRLMQQGVPILHIDNPVINGDVEENGEFLRKTIDGVKSLSAIYKWLGGDPQFCELVSLLRFYVKVKQFRMTWIVMFVYRLIGHQLERTFISGRHISMTMFSFYKLALLIENTNNDRN